VQALAIGNGTGSREVSQIVQDFLRQAGLASVFSVTVSEAGASVYSASEIARQEFPDLDLTVRGAISIARRLQDPLAELVKVDPKSIGVGQYQHDVDQRKLKQGLEQTVESCVNRVGVDLNTASWALLRYVAGVNERTAQKIVEYRNENGRFRSRTQLMAVPGFGPKTFEQAAGFLRIRGGENPLDMTAVHPESYPVVEKIASSIGASRSMN
jgi:protein Tex